MALSTATDFLALKGKRRFAPVTGLEDLGLAARMRSLSERERATYEAQLLNPKKGGFNINRLKMAKVSLIILSLVDTEGNQIFADNNAGDMLELDSALTDHLYEQVREHIGFDEGDIEKLTGNSETPTQNDSPIV
jgi:hypothetical protein